MANVIDRQRQLYENPAKHPIIYLINVDAAYTATTKKGMFTGLGGKVPAYGSVSTVVDYAIVGPGVQIRGTTTCTLGKRPMAKLIALQTSEFAAEGSALCDGSATPKS